MYKQLRLHEPKQRVTSADTQDKPQWNDMDKEITISQRYWYQIVFLMSP